MLKTGQNDNTCSCSSERKGAGKQTSLAFATVVFIRSCLIKSVTIFRNSAHLFAKHAQQTAARSIKAIKKHVVWHWSLACTSAARRRDLPVSSTATELSSPLAVAHAASLLPAQQPLRREQRLHYRAKCEWSAKAPHATHAAAHYRAAAPEHADYRRSAAVAHSCTERGFRRGEQRAH